MSPPGLKLARDPEELFAAAALVVDDELQLLVVGGSAGAGGPVGSALLRGDPVRAPLREGRSR